MVGVSPLDDPVAVEYKWFPIMHPQPWCWWCGRGQETYYAPDWWGSVWLIERAHIVNKPRVEDRRAVVLLCSLCHKLSHGETFNQETIRAPSLNNMLWIKERFDPGFYCRRWLRDRSVRSLPRKARPTNAVVWDYFERRGAYP